MVKKPAADNKKATEKKKTKLQKLSKADLKKFAVTGGIPTGHHAAKNSD